jgi:hypothetical protein
LVVPQAGQDDLLLSVMKLTHIASAHNAAQELIGAGYVQEVDSLSRMIDADCDDIVSMAGPLTAAPVQSDDRDRVIDRSFQPQTPRLAQTVQRQAKSLFRPLLAVALVARGANRPEVVEQVCDLAGELVRTTGCLDARGTAGESTD